MGGEGHLYIETPVIQCQHLISELLIFLTKIYAFSDALSFKVFVKIKVIS